MFYHISYNMKTKLCSSCVRNINSEYIKSEWDVCQFCREFEKHKDNLIWNFKKIEWKFVDSITKNKKSDGGYDCLVMVSWWKDSIMSLYKIKKETNLKCLAYTFDNGFESKEALENIEKAVDLLQVDRIVDRPGYMKQVYVSILKERVPISLCRFCAPLMFNRAIKFASANKIPYIVTGWNKWQSDREPSRHKLWNLPNEELKSLEKKFPFLKDIWVFPEENDMLLKKYNIKFTSPWIFEKRDTSKYMDIIKKELWRKIPKISYPKDSTNCILNFLQVVLSRKFFWYTHYDCEESLLINYWEKTKKEAIKTLDQDIDKKIIYDILDTLHISLKDIGLTKSDLDKYCCFKG